MDSNEPHWSSDVHQADWIGPRLAPWGGDHTAAIVVPAGFAAYARVLHPAGIPEHGERLVRWADVAAWSGMPLRQDAQFHSIALPPAAPGGPPPYDSQGPREGSLYGPDAEVLAGILRDWTATPEDCWFCVWDGYRLGNRPSRSPSSPRRGSRPQSSRSQGGTLCQARCSKGRGCSLPYRDYLLYQGPAEAALTLPALEGTFGQCPNLWWPADRAWCVASEIDLPWTYVGGPRGLIDAILADDRIEALPAAPNDPVSRVEDWVAAWADQLSEDLLTHGAASLSTPRGSVDARLRPPHGTAHGRTAHRGHRTQRRFQQLLESPRPGRGRTPEHRAPLRDYGRAEPHREVTG